MQRYKQANMCVCVCISHAVVCVYVIILFDRVTFITIVGVTNSIKPRKNAMVTVTIIVLQHNKNNVYPVNTKYT